MTRSQPITAHLVPPLPLPVHGAALDAVELGPLPHPEPVLSLLGLQGKHENVLKYFRDNAMLLYKRFKSYQGMHAWGFHGLFGDFQIFLKV